MIFTIIVCGTPHASESAHTAYHFTRAALKKGHVIKCLFFYSGGALNGSATVPANTPANFQLSSAWRELKHAYAIDLLLCSGSAAKTGVISAQAAKREGLQSTTIAPGFEISGLGSLTEAMVKSDRVVTFGSAL